MDKKLCEIDFESFSVKVKTRPEDMKIVVGLQGLKIIDSLIDCMTDVEYSHIVTDRPNVFLHEYLDKDDLKVDNALVEIHVLQMTQKSPYFVKDEKRYM